MRRPSRADLTVAALLVILALGATGCGTVSEVLEPSAAVSSGPVLPGTESPPLSAAIAGEVASSPDRAVGTGSLSLATEAAGQGISAQQLIDAPPRVPTSEAPVTEAAAELAPAPAADVAPEPAATAGIEGAGESPAAQIRDNLDAAPEDYDPWEPFNERMFAFNYNVDRYVLKPAANVYRHVIPEPFQLMIANGFDNIRFPPRFVNLMLQGRFWGAFLESSRFVINSVMGIGGLFNPATDYFGIPRVPADFGQTLAKWGVGPGPYFVPPLLPPATVRDFIGRLADSAINPIGWFLFNFWPEAVSIGAGEMVNERAVNYEAFQGVEETTLDLYTAVRDGYLRRRERQLQQPQE